MKPAQPYLVTLLGTHTEFTAKKDDVYTRGETLSIASCLSAKIMNTDEKQTIGHTALENGLVIDGPNTLGENVGEKITEALIAILEALRKGHKDISVIAHSRGAVQAILVAQELKRIKDEIEKSRPKEQSSAKSSA